MVATVPMTRPRHSATRAPSGSIARNCAQSWAVWFQPHARHNRRPSPMSDGRIDRINTFGPPGQSSERESDAELNLPHLARGTNLAVGGRAHVALRIAQVDHVERV